MTSECARVQGINLAQGVCDTELPRPIREAVVRAIEEGKNIYARMDGIVPLKEAIARKVSAYNGIEADPNSEVLVTSGATGALYAACLALFNPGDEVILFEPFYGYHVNTLLSLRLAPNLQSLATGSWAIDFDALKRAITPRTRAILLNTPTNPCGKVFTRTELEAIGALAVEHDLWVISDEIYEYFVFDGAKHISPASLPELADRTVTISGFSKTFSITGWRVGYLVAPAHCTRAITMLHDLIYICSPSPAQYGVLAGLMQLDEPFYRSLASGYRDKRDRLCRTLAASGLAPFVPGGAYYVLADASALAGSTAREKARSLLAQTCVASVPGSAFYGPTRGENLIRFCFAKKEAELDEACDRLQRLRL
jgi:aminotransferase